MARKKTKHEFDENIEERVLDIVVNNEYKIAKQNQDSTGETADFESYIDMFDAERTEKDYDWMSNVFIPEFSTHMLTQSSIDVSQYFATRDFIETYIQDPSIEALKAADATEELINRTLNQRELHHYQKFVRAKAINHLLGHVDALCFWRQESGNDGNMVVDRFDYEILDPRNVFSSNDYTYSIQEKDWIIVRMERSKQQLRQEAKSNNYINLYLLDDFEEQSDTDTKKETRDDRNPTTGFDNKISKKYDVLRRYGKFWVKDGKPGLDKNGDVLDDAELKEMIITTVISRGGKLLIGFNETPYIDAMGVPYKPLIRGLCYIHPITDAGVGDGRYARELQIAINDTFNMSNDRVRLATMPTFKVNKLAAEDTDTLYFEPGHGMEVNNKDDITEFRIQDNIQGAMQQLGLLTGKMQQANAVYPSTMGDIPQDASTTATAIVGGAQNTQTRTNYKSLTFEYTFLTELYWMIQQMTWTFALPETGTKLMGEKVYDFNPTLDYYFKPLSQSVETAESKQMKIKNWTTILGYLVQINNPQLINYVLAQIITLSGDEYANFASVLFNPEEPVQPVESQESPEGQGGGGASNQTGIEQGATEQMARGMF